MQEQFIYDVIIVGGGLIGVSLAHALCKTSLKIAIIEAKPWFRDDNISPKDSKVIALSPSSQRIFQGIGAWRALAPHTTAIKRIHISDQGHFGFTRLDSQQFGMSALGYIINAQQLNHCLQESLITDCSPTIFAPAQLLHMGFNDTDVTVQVALNGQVTTLHTRLIVAADGDYSTVRQRLGITLYEHDYGQTAIVTNVTLSRSHEYTAYERFTPSGPLALLPLGEKTCSIVWTVDKSAVESVIALSTSDFLQALQHQFGWRLGQLLHAGPRQAFPLFLRYIQNHSIPRVVLVGNAAHTVHPIGGQGLNLGLREVATLAEVIVEAHHNGKDVGDASVLQHYHACQQVDQQQIVTLTDILVQLFSNRFPPLVIARNVGLFITDILSPLKKRLVQQMAGLRGYSSRLLRGLSLEK